MPLDRSREFAELFAREAAGGLHEVAQALDRLAEGQSAAAELAVLNDVAHLLAGSAAVLEYHAIAAVARELDQGLAPLRAAGRPLTREEIEHLRTGFRTLADGCARVAPAPSGDTTASARAPRERRAGPLIVQIEDNPVNALLIERIVDRRPHITLATYTDGRSGIEAVLADRPCLVVLDLHLPDMSGEEVLRELRAVQCIDDLQIIVSSGDVTAQRQRQVMAAGASAFLGKPFDVGVLLELIDKACGDVPGRGCTA